MLSQTGGVYGHRCSASTGAEHTAHGSSSCKPPASPCCKSGG